MIPALERVFHRGNRIAIEVTRQEHRITAQVGDVDIPRRHNLPRQVRLVTREGRKRKNNEEGENEEAFHGVPRKVQVAGGR